MPKKKKSQQPLPHIPSVAPHLCLMSTGKAAVLVRTTDNLWFFFTKRQGRRLIEETEASRETKIRLLTALRKMDMFDAVIYEQPPINMRGTQAQMIINALWTFSTSGPGTPLRTDMPPMQGTINISAWPAKKPRMATLWALYPLDGEGAFNAYFGMANNHDHLLRLLHRLREADSERRLSEAMYDDVRRIRLPTRPMKKHPCEPVMFYNQAARTLAFAFWRTGYIAIPE